MFGAPGGIRTPVGRRPTDLQSVVIDRSTTDAVVYRLPYFLFTFKLLGAINIF